MKRTTFLNMMGLAMAAGLAGCGEAGSSASDTVPATVSLSQGSSAALSAAAVNVASIILGDHIRLAAIDSLMVTVTRVDVLPDSEIHRCHPPVGDSAHGFRPGRPEGPEGEGHGPGDPMGPPPGGCGRHRALGHDDDHPPRPDSLVPPDTGWGSRPEHWYSLDVVGSGKLDLLNLPTDSNGGLVLASGSLPAGEYGAARLIVSDAKIWFNTTITSDDGVVLQPNTAYDVLLPNHHGQMGIMTNTGFTVPDGGGNVVLIFDPNVTIGGAGVTDSGQVVIRPVLRPHRGHN